MKKLEVNSKTIGTLVFVFGMLFLGSCTDERKNAASTDPDLETQNSTTEGELLIGSWKDASEAALDFTLFKDGTARSDNMKTLLYKTWSVKGDQVTFTIESIGSGTSSTGDVTYTIEELTKSDLVLKEGTSLSTYTRK